ncbi:MAG: toprim domain-containing protein [Bradyrhizobium sp.]|nr:toprim domain-containing protein [Bradyrhizobium sp.]
MRGDTLENATAKYQEWLAEAGSFLLSRGIGSTVARRFRLGFVAEPFSVTHEDYIGRLAIPYITASGVVAIRFRKIDDSDGPKYIQPKGSRSHLYNAGALIQSHSLVVATEGELDAITCEAYGGIPAVGIAGVNAWRPEFTRCFESAETVLVAGDGDSAGAGMVERLCELLPNAVPAQMPEGADINSFYLEHGAQALTDYLLEKL